MRAHSKTSLWATGPGGGWGQAGDSAQPVCILDWQASPPHPSRRSGWPGGARPAGPASAPTGGSPAPHRGRCSGWGHLREQGRQVGDEPLRKARGRASGISWGCCLWACLPCVLPSHRQLTQAPAVQYSSSTPTCVAVSAQAPEEGCHYVRSVKPHAPQGGLIRAQELVHLEARMGGVKGAALTTPAKGGNSISRGWFKGWPTAVSVSQPLGDGLRGHTCFPPALCALC